jgi:hypothetical protein
MLAKFDNGYFLEVLIEKDENGKEELEIVVYDEVGDFVTIDFAEYQDVNACDSTNLIDYALRTSNVGYVKGKYKMLNEETMDDYLASCKPDPNGKWVLEAQGTDDEYIKRYLTEEAAQAAMTYAYNEVFDEKHPCMACECDENYAFLGDEEFYQSWKVYQEKTSDNPLETQLIAIQMELNRADVGVTQYAYELMDTDVIREHLYKVECLLDELKEMIKEKLKP